MILIRKSQERGDANHGWLQSKHTFSFADYSDEKFMGFGALRVINEDRIQGGTGFSTHGHRDMEIVSYVIDGALEHKDSMGNETLIRPGEVQRMSAGTGIRHSEYNHLKNQQTHFLQIWILPQKNGIEPSYDQKSFTSHFSDGDLILVASQDGKSGSVTINQDTNIYAAKTPRAGEKILPTNPQRHIWVQVVKGDVFVEDVPLQAGDGAGLTLVENIKIKWSAESEFLVLDVPK